MPATGLPGTIGNLVRRRELLFGEAMLPLEKSQGVQFPEIAANIQPMKEPNEQIAEGSTKVPAMTTIRKPDPPEQETKQEVEAKPRISNTEILWRYVPLERLFCYLSGSIFIPSLQKLHEEDPFEAECLFDPRRFPSAMREQHRNQAEEIFSFLDKRKRPPAKERHEAYFDFLRKTRYAWCWFCRAGESALMWNTYGRHGAAIRTTVGKLRSFLESCGRDFVYGRMLYVTVNHGQVRCPHLDPDRPEAQPFLLEPCFLKRSEYRDEDEVRFVTTTTDLDGGFFLRRKELDVPIKADDWIDEILLWPKLLSSEARALKGAIEQLQPTISCRRSELLSGQEQQFTDSIGGLSDDMGALCEEGCRDGSDGVPEALMKLLVGANRTAGQNGNTI